MSSQYHSMSNLDFSPLVQAVQKHFKQKTADLVYLFYVSLICYSPFLFQLIHGHSPLPWSLFSYGGPWISWKKTSSLLEEDCWLRDLIWRDYVDPSNDAYCHDCLTGCASLEEWKAFGKIAAVTVADDRLCLCRVEDTANHQELCNLRLEGLAKGPLLFYQSELDGYGAQPRRYEKKACWPILMRISAQITTCASLKKKMWSRNQAPSQSTKTVPVWSGISTTTIPWRVAEGPWAGSTEM